MESRRLFADEQLVVAAPGYRGGNLPTTPQAIAASDIIFPWSLERLVQPGGAGKKPIVPAGLRLNDSNLVLEAVRLGAGVALERRSLVAGAIARGELVQLTAVTVPYPWHYWLTVSPQAENRPEVARFIARLEEEIAPGASRSLLSLRPTAAGLSGRRAPGRDARNRARRDTDRGAEKTVRPPR